MVHGQMGAVEGAGDPSHGINRRWLGCSSTGVLTWQIERVSGFHVGPSAGTELLPGCWVNGWMGYLLPYPSPVCPQEANPLLLLQSSPHLREGFTLPAPRTSTAGSPTAQVNQRAAGPQSPLQDQRPRSALCDSPSVPRALVLVSQSQDSPPVPRGPPHGPDGF